MSCLQKLNMWPKGYDAKLLTEDLRFIDADPSGSCVWEMAVDETWCNMNGVLHGGAYGVIFGRSTYPLIAPVRAQWRWWDCCWSAVDMCTAITMQTISRPGYWEYVCRPFLQFFPFIKAKADVHRFLAGVTRTLNMSYLKAIPLGTQFHSLLQITHCHSIDHLTWK